MSRAESGQSPLLLVDDHDLSLTLAIKILMQIGFGDVDAASNGASALAMMHNRTYRAVISDWNMPEMDGLTLLRAMRSDTRLRYVPFLLSSVDGSFERIKTALDAGVTAFVLKPFERAKLKAKLQEVCFARSDPTGRRW